MRIRSVNGWGPRCGCGGESTIHVTPAFGKRGTFLCVACVLGALDAHIPASQPDFWPGDEDRDEPYVDPRKEASRVS